MTPHKHQLAPGHNPDKLTNAQVGKGYRLLKAGKEIPQNAEYWIPAGGWNQTGNPGKILTGDSTLTYRVPNTPTPEVDQSATATECLQACTEWTPQSDHPRCEEEKTTAAPSRFFIPQDDAIRKRAPMFRGLLGYFPAALFEVAAHSYESNEKHNPGQPLHWARGKSSDHADCIVRHLIDAGDAGTDDRKYHLRALAWRALALLQEECERQGARPGVSSV